MVNYQLLDHKRKEFLDVLGEIDEKNYLSDKGKDYFITKYVYFDLDDDAYEEVAKLYVKQDSVKSVKAGNIVFNLKESFYDILKSSHIVLDTIGELLKIEDNEVPNILKRITIVIKFLAHVLNLSAIVFEEDSAKVILKLLQMRADIKPVKEEDLKQQLEDMQEVSKILDNLLSIKCINIDDGKIMIRESVNGDWMI